MKPLMVTYLTLYWFLEKSMRSFLISCFLSLVFCQERVDGLVAIVGDNIITESDFFQQLSMVAQQKNINPSLTPLKYKELEGRVLNNIINQYVLLEHAKKDTNVFIDNLEVQDQLERQISSFIESVGSVDSLEAFFGKSLQNIKAEYWEDVYNAMLIEKYKYFLFSSVSVGLKEIELYYDEYKDSLPPSPLMANFTLYNIQFLPGEKTYNSVFLFTNSLKDSLSSGFFSFEDMAIKYSNDYATASSGGVVGFTNRGSLLKEYEEAAYSLVVGEVVGPIKTRAGYHIIKLLDKKGEKINTQHLLRVVTPTEDDRAQTVAAVYDVLEKSKADPLFLEQHINDASSLTPLSGTFQDFVVSNLPEEVSFIIKTSKESHLHDPVVLSDGSILIVYVYELFEPQPPTIENSYDLIRALALDKKSKEFIKNWFDLAKKEIFIKIFI